MRSIFRKSIVINGTLVLMLAGCATAAQRQYQNIAANNQAAAQEMKSCVAAVWDSPDSEPLHEKVPAGFDFREATLEQMMDSSKATKSDIKVIKQVHEEIHQCRKALLERVATTAPTLAAVLADAYQKADADLIKLIQHKSTWGEYVKSGKELALATNHQLTQEGQRIAGSLQQSHEAELARRQAATNAMLQYYQTQEMIDAMNRPQVNTATCTGMGNTVNCVGVSR